jgi:hypothetical protein
MKEKRIKLKKKIESLQKDLKQSVDDEMKNVLLSKGYGVRYDRYYTIYEHPTLPTIQLWAFNIKDILVNVKIIYDNETLFKWVCWRFLEQSFEECYNSRRNFKLNK